VPVLWRYSCEWCGDLEGNSSFDDVNGRLQVAVSTQLLSAHLGGDTVAEIVGSFKVRSAKDEINMGVVSF
jgi:hypothetical protein